MANERRLIEANALIAELIKSAEYHEERRLGYFSAIDHIREQPTVDAVEVVRCKDCEYYHKYNCYAQNLINNKTYVLPLHKTWPDDYCSCGERRDE